MINIVSFWRRCLGKSRHETTLNLFFLIIGQLSLATSALAQSPALLWEDQIDQARRADFAVAVTASRGKVIAVGWTTDAHRNRDILVRAYQGANGALLWQDRYDFAGALDQPTALIAADPIAVIGGSVTNRAGNADWFLRAYDLAAGKVLWQEVLDIDGGNEQFLGLATSGNSLFATGIAACDTDSCKLITRAYDLSSGTLRWSQHSANVDGQTASVGIAARDDRLFITANVARTASTDGSTFLLQAYDANSGRALWRDGDRPAGAQSIATQVAVHSGRLYAVGARNNSWLVRAYEAASGQLLWEQSYCLACDRPGAANAALQVAADGARVVVAGYGSPTGSERAARDWIVRSYDAKTGRPMWTDHLDFAGSRDEAGGGLAMTGEQVFAYGTVFSAASLQDLLIRAYDARSGAVLWQDRIDKAGFADETASAGSTALAVDQGRVTIAGGSGIRRADGVIDTDWIIRTYDARR